MSSTYVELPRGTWRRDDLLERRILFLDLKYWIGILDGDTPARREMASLTRKLVGDGRLICPVAPSLILEVAKRTETVRRNSLWRLMDELSLGLSLRVSYDIFGDEFRHALNAEPVVRMEAFDHHLAAMLRGVGLAFPNEGWPPDKQAEATALIFREIGSVTIEQTMVLLAEGMPDPLGPLRDGWRLLAAEGNVEASKKRLSRAEIEAAEFAGTVRAFTPLIVKVGLSDTPLTERFGRRHLGNARDASVEALKSCPTFWCQYKLTSALRFARPELTENDFWDLTHMSAALPYTDCVACDKAARHIAHEMLRADQRFGVEVVSRDEDLRDWLRRLDSITRSAGPATLDGGSR